MLNHKQISSVKQLSLSGKVAFERVPGGVNEALLTAWLQVEYEPEGAVPSLEKKVGDQGNTARG